MITLKVIPYTKKELEMLYDVLGEGVAMITSIKCQGNCRECEYRHPCRDIKEAQEWLGTAIENRRGK